MRNIGRRTSHKYTLNYSIHAPTLRVIDNEGKQIGVLTKEEALAKAQGEGRDLVLIAPQAQPPVAKIIDFKKFLYQEEKKQKEARKGVKKGTIKELKLSVFIAAGDLERLTERGREFLNEGHQLRVSLTLRGREIIKRDMGIELMNRYIQNLGDVNVAKEPRLEGRVIRAVISRKK